MITVVVQFSLSKAINTKTAHELFLSGVDTYINLPGLVRKYYLNDPENGIAGGCYLFESRVAADNLFTGDWYQMVESKYGAPPSVMFFDSPVIVDNSKNSEHIGLNK